MSHRVITPLLPQGLELGERLLQKNQQNLLLRILPLIPLSHYCRLARLRALTWEMTSGCPDLSSTGKQQSDRPASDVVAQVIGSIPGAQNRVNVKDVESCTVPNAALSDVQHL